MNITYAQGYTKDNTDKTCPSKVAYGDKTYNAVQIGAQCWFKENLNIGIMVDSLQHQINNSTIEKYCYNNDTANCRMYGGLYQWNEAMQYSSAERAQGICPTGWHIPSNGEFQTLQTTVNDLGGALKEVEQGMEKGIATNTSGFSAILSGYRTWNGMFDNAYFDKDYFDNGYTTNIGFNTSFWSSTEHGATGASNLLLYYKENSIALYFSSKESGFSIRCLKD